jgi:hypothetical protein
MPGLDPGIHEEGDQEGRPLFFFFIDYNQNGQQPIECGYKATMNIPEALTIASRTLELTKALRDIDHRIELAELKNKAADIYQSMADLKMALVDAHEELQSKDKEIQRLLKEFAFKGETIERHNMIYEKRDNGPVGFPFCPRCLG